MTTQVIGILILVGTISYSVGWIRGHFIGFREGTSEATRKHGRIAGRQLRDNIYGPVHGRN